MRVQRRVRLLLPALLPRLQSPPPLPTHVPFKMAGEWLFRFSCSFRLGGWTDGWCAASSPFMPAFPYFKKKEWDSPTPLWSCKLSLTGCSGLVERLLVGSLAVVMVVVCVYIYIYLKKRNNICLRSGKEACGKEKTNPLLSFFPPSFSLSLSLSLLSFVFFLFVCRDPFVFCGFAG